ncbi:MAG TPA: hypothetical protein VJ901_09215 [Thermoanaerobaculia bacterium]|nr:hypothetical protein [Thermoanaerobaculia bacterium]
MITKSELQALHGRIVAERRNKVGPPPTDDELFAFMRGELSAEDESRVRELLLAYPELARAIAEPFPEDDGGVLSEIEMKSHWNALQKRIHGDAGSRNVRAWQWMSAALAAALVVAVVGLVRFHNQSIAPRVATDAPQLLLPDGQRSTSSEFPVLNADGDSYVLLASLINPPSFQSFRLELIDQSSSRTIWSSRNLQRPANDTFQLVVPRSFLASGKYRLEVYGVNGERQELLATYRMRVPAS